MKTLLLYNIVAWFSLVTSTLAIKNRTSLDRGLGRAAKALGIFSVVKFPNSQCTGTATINGTCYTSEECSAKAGVSSGTCASGFGVCCTFSLACGTTTKENNTIHEITSFSTTDTTPCVYEICPCQTDVCKLRIDFSTFSIMTPWTSLIDANGAQYTKTVTNVDADQVLGDCLVDQFTVSGTGVTNPPVMCGLGSGQHMFVDITPDCTKLTFAIDTLTTFTRSWSFSVKQILCSEELSKHNCLQYFTGASGTFNSWNYDTSITTVAPGATVHHLNDQEYDICFRQETGYCKICYSVALTNAAAILTSFGVSASGDGDGTKAAATDTLCDGLTAGYEDYIEVSCGVASTVTDSLTCPVTEGASKLCGYIFNAKVTDTAVATVCSFSVPFRWGVHFDSKEEVIDDCSANLNTCENQVSGGGGIGFHMQWWQETC